MKALIAYIIRELLIYLKDIIALNIRVKKLKEEDDAKKRADDFSDLM